ncbi:MAG: hypothetical protein KBF33_07835, partial [Comamonas sp.]|nr:hypothetical protein [Comamonas sp.]
MTSHFNIPSFGLQRRHLLGGALAASVVQLAPLSWAAQPVSPAATGAFMALSQYLTERNHLSPKLAGRMQAGLQSLDSHFTAHADALWQWVQAQQVTLA